MRGLRNCASILALAAVLGGASAILHPGARAVLANEPREDEITVASARALPPTALWIDARTRPEFEAGHVDGALLLNEDEWSELLLPVIERWQPDVPVVVYCDTGGCQASRKVATRLREEAGVANVRVLRGDWRELRGGR